MLEDLFRNRPSPLQPVFPQADWQMAAGDVSGMPAAGRVKPPPARCATTTGLVARPGQAAGVQAGTSVCAKAARSSDSPSPWQHSASAEHSPCPQTPARYSRTAQAGAAAAPLVHRPLLWGGGSPRGMEGARNEAPSTKKARAGSQQMATAPCFVFTELSEVGVGKLLPSRSCFGGIQQHRYKPR